MHNKKVVIKYSVVIAIVIAIILSCVSLSKSYKTISIEKKLYEDKVSFKGIYLINENVIYEGELINSDIKIKDGEVIQSGKVVYKDIKSNVQGKAVLYIDGYENKFTIQNIKNIQYAEFDKIKNMPKRKGIKVLDNSLWTLCIVANKDSLKTIKKGEYVNLEVNGNYYESYIKDIFIKNENVFVVLNTKYDLPEFNRQRYFEGFIINAKYYGYILPRDCVVEYNGKQGVFIKKGEYAYFKPIKINHMDYKICVTNDEVLKERDEIIINPKGLKDKQRVKR